MPTLRYVLLAGVIVTALADCTWIVRPQPAPIRPATWTAELRPDEVVPAAHSLGRGKATFVLSPDSSTLEFTLELVRIAGVAEAHVHLGQPGENGPVIATLSAAGTGIGFTNRPRVIEGRLGDRDLRAQRSEGFDGTVAGLTLQMSKLVKSVGLEPRKVSIAIGEEVTLETLLKEAARGNAYVDVHTPLRPAGELRGHIQPTSQAAREPMPIWSIADPHIASVDRAGKVKGLCTGSSMVTATIGSAHGEARVTVKDAVRKTYTVGFIVLAPENTDLTSAETQEYLRRVNDVRLRLPNQFLATTCGTGAVDASYPIVVLKPPPPIYENSDDHLMWAFLRRTMREQFYTAHPDIFDFLAVYEIYPDKTIVQRHHSIKPFVGGFGLTVSNDGSAAWGSSGRLRGLGLVEDATTMPAEYDWLRSGMWIVLHEVFGHQWGVNPDRIGGSGSGGHWIRTVEAPTNSIMYATTWRKVDETHFRTALIEDQPTVGFCHPQPGVFGGICEKMTFHPWLLYVAGMKTRSEVPASLIEVIPDFPIVDDVGDQANSAADMKRWAKYTNGITGSYNTITLQEIINQAGDRYDVTSWNKAPVVDIELPQDGSTLPQGTAIVFRASASDPEDGNLVPSWTSSLDGALGTGTQIVSSTLSVGTHTIRATAIDSQGGSTMHQTDLIRITIAP